MIIRRPNPSIYVLLITFLLTGCVGQVNSTSQFTPVPDGRFDNNTYLVNPARMDLSRMAASIVTLITRTTFEGPDGEIVYKELEGNGVVVGQKYVLTVEHSVAQHGLSVQTSVGALELPVKKIHEETFLLWKKNRSFVKVKFKDRKNDIVLFELPEDIRPPSFPYPLGNSNDLEIGNYLYIIGNPLNLGVNIREGIVSSLQAPEHISKINARAENTFMVSNGLVPGDSGTPVIAVRDGRFELVGISLGTFVGNNRLGWAIRINKIRELLLSKQRIQNPKEESHTSDTRVSSEEPTMESVFGQNIQGRLISHNPSAKKVF